MYLYDRELMKEHLYGPSATQIAVMVHLMKDILMLE